MKLGYDQIGEDIVARIPLQILPQRDQVNLFLYLMDRLGIGERFGEEADATERAQEIIVEQLDLAWNDPARK